MTTVKQFEIDSKRDVTDLKNIQKVVAGVYKHDKGNEDDIAIGDAMRGLGM
jgi:hypothetical protein